ncbi:hypothetical protein [Dactylosporangium sp. CA-139066]|uniref:hypothetical protein n=1 Tax=Dactylosporangium sp. CA-139066 TaxID=3239930 RepID=UPI003D8F0E53
MGRSREHHQVTKPRRIGARAPAVARSTGVAAASVSAFNIGSHWPVAMTIG